MIPAIIAIYLASTGQVLESKDVRYDPRHCNLHECHAEMANNGEWVPIVIRLRKK